MMADRLRRVAVVGSSCSGKTTFARALAAKLGVAHVELDALHWGPNWTPRQQDEFRARVAHAVAAADWVIDGNYAAVRDLVWTRATALVWLDFSFPLTFSRALARTFRRIVSGEELYSGNQESLRGIVNPDWIPWWVIRTYRRRRREFRELLRRAEFAHLQVLEFTHPRQAETFLAAAPTTLR